MTHVLTLPAELTIHGAALLRSELQAALDAACATAPAADLRLDAGTVVEVDAAGLQVLAALVHACGVRGCILELADASDVVRKAAADLGLTQFLNLTEGALA